MKNGHKVFWFNSALTMIVISFTWPNLILSFAWAFFYWFMAIQCAVMDNDTELKINGGDVKNE